MSTAPPAASAVALSLQRALLGAVTANLRAVSFELEADFVLVTFVYDGAPSADDCEAAEIAVTEMLSDFPDHDARETILRVDAPAPLPALNGRLVYRRKED